MEHGLSLSCIFCYYIGNITFRACVKACQHAYIEAKRRDKPYIAQRIVLFVRKMGGRFLKRERDTEVDEWKDVGNNKAREKTSQALREGAPELRGDVVKETSHTPDMVSYAPPEHPGAAYDGAVYEHAYAELYHHPHHHRGAVPMVPPSSQTLHHQQQPHPHQQHHHHGFTMEPSRRPTKKQRPNTGHAFTTSATSRPTLHAGVSVDSIRPHDVCGTTDGGKDGSTMATTNSGVPGSPRYTVSADEEERSHSSSSVSPTTRPDCIPSAPRGPRLMLL